MKLYFCNLVIIVIFCVLGNNVYSQSGKCLATFNYHSKLVSSVSFSPDNSKLYTGSFDGTIYEIDLVSFKETLYKKITKVWDIKNSNIGDYIITTFGDWNYNVYFLDNNVGNKFTWSSPVYPDFNAVKKCAISKDDDFLAFSFNDNVNVLIRQQGKFVNYSSIITDNRDFIKSIVFSLDNNYIILGGNNGIVHIVDVKTRKTILKLNEAQGQNNEIIALTINRKGKRIATGDSRGVVRFYRSLWNEGNPNIKLTYTFEAHNDKINAINFVNDTLFATASSDGLIKIWSGRELEKSGKPIAVFDNYGVEISSMSISQDGNYLASGSADGVVKIWDISDIISGNNQPTVNNYNQIIDKYTVDIKNENNKAVDNTVFSFDSPVVSKTEIEVVEPKPKVNNQQTITQNTTTPISMVNKNIENDVDSIMFFEQNSKKNTYVLIIGNEDYSKSQTTTKTEINVPYAINDADVFKTYCIKILGIPENQIIILKDGTSAQMKRSIYKLKEFSKIENGNAELIFYYSGHGLPNEQTKEPFLIPVDVNSADLTDAISLSFLFKSLTEHPTQRITVFLDACFSGGARNMSLVAQKSISINPEKLELDGKIVVFASSEGTESSGVYEEKKHGYFTYFLLKKLKETKGDINYKELFDYLKYEVSKQSLINDKKQTPTLNVSPEIQNDWLTWKLK